MTSRRFQLPQKCRRRKEDARTETELAISPIIYVNNLGFVFLRKAGKTSRYYCLEKYLISTFVRFVRFLQISNCKLSILSLLRDLSQTFDHLLKPEILTDCKMAEVTRCRNISFYTYLQIMLPFIIKVFLKKCNYKIILTPSIKLETTFSMSTCKNALYKT